MIRISEFSKKSVTFPVVLFSESVIRKGVIPAFSSVANFSDEVVEPFTESPFESKAFAKGKPSQPQPRILIFVIFVFQLFDFQTVLYYCDTLFYNRIYNSRIQSVCNHYWTWFYFLSNDHRIVQNKWRWHHPVFSFCYLK